MDNLYTLCKGYKADRCQESLKQKSMQPIYIVLMVMIGWSGILCLLVGYLFKQNQSLEILSLPNFSIEKVKDKQGLSLFIGTRMMLVGVTALLTAASIGLLPQFLLRIILLFILSVVVIICELAINKKRYLI
jgi:hypothetical protein